MNNFLPPVVKNLLILNGLFFLALISLEKAFGIDLNDYLGLHLIGSEKFHPYQFVTYMFMHANLMHILFNMLALWMFGKMLEMVWGGKRFFIYYMVTGIGAALIHYATVYYELYPVLKFIENFIANPDGAALKNFITSPDFKLTSFEFQEYFNSFVQNYNQLALTSPSEAARVSIEFMGRYRLELLNAPVVVGASGAVFGILLAFGMLFPNSIIYIYFAIPMKAKYLVILYGLFELYSGVANNAGDNVAHFAHLGGMLFGFILIKLWKVKTNLY